MNKALDEVRAEETRRMRLEGRAPVLKKSRWLLLKRSENLGDEQHFRLRDLLRYNLKTVRAYLLKEAFQQLWDYNSPTWAGKFLDEWCRQTLRSRIEPMKKIARSLRQHRELILNYFRAQKLISSGGIRRFGRRWQSLCQSHRHRRGGRDRCRQSLRRAALVHRTVQESGLDGYRYRSPSSVQRVS